MPAAPKAITLFTAADITTWHRSGERRILLVHVLDASNSESMSVGFAPYAPGESNGWIVISRAHRRGIRRLVPRAGHRGPFGPRKASARPLTRSRRWRRWATRRSRSPATTAAGAWPTGWRSTTPRVVTCVAVLDIVPTGEVWARADATMALGYWHGAFLAQPSPLPERGAGA